MIKILLSLIYALLFIPYLPAQALNMDSINLHNPQKDDKIARLNSAEEIEKIIKEFPKMHIEEIEINTGLFYSDKNDKRVSDSLQVKPWVKADFDGNGYTDILVIGMDDNIVIMNYGKKRMKVYNISKEFTSTMFPVFRMMGTTPVIIRYILPEPDFRHIDSPRSLMADTLVYRFDDFIEFNQDTATHKIEKIEFATTECFGTCPVFELHINEDRTAEYNAIMYNDKQGKLTTTIDKDSYKRLTTLLNYINFEKLNDNYRVSVTDMSGAILTITYDDGKIKKIDDYPMQGTKGLMRLYRLLYELRTSQNWH